MKFIFDNIGKIFIFVLVLNLTLGGLATEYVVETWGSYIKETPVDFSFPLASVIGLFLGEVLIPLAVITFLIFSVI